MLRTLGSVCLHRGEEIVKVAMIPSAMLTIIESEIISI